MDPFTIGAIAAPIIGGMIGNSQAQGSLDAANQARQQALAQYLGIDIPTLESQMLNLQQYQSAGTLDPILEQLVQQGDTALAGVSTDPRLRQEQMSALESIAGLASGNPTQADTAGFELARQNAAAEMQAKNNQVLQEMAQRGQAGSGAELLAKLKNNQSGAQMLQKVQLEQAQAMQQARLAALQQQSNMASNLRNQDYGEASNLAKARDVIANFNAQNAQSVGARNVAAQNQAQAGNLQNAQQISSANTGLLNQQQTHNKGLQQTQFQNQMQRANGIAGQYGNQAIGNQQQAANTAAMWGNIGQGIGTGLTGFAKK